MVKQIPSAAQVRERLQAFSRSQVQKLSDLSGVPFHTLLKVKSGETENPGIDTVSRFWPHISKAA